MPAETANEADNRPLARFRERDQRGVYAPGRRALTREGRWMAAVLASGPDAVLSHWSAAALWIIRPSSRSIIDVTTPRKSRSWKGVRRHHKPLPADEVTVEEGIPVTSVPRTILDLAATESLDVVENLLREIEYRELRDRLSLWDLIERYPGRLDRSRHQALPSRLSLAGHGPNRRVGWLGRTPDPHRLSRRPCPRPHPPRRRLLGDSAHLEPTG